MFMIGFLVSVLTVRFILVPKNQILYFRERDGRGQELGFEREDALSFRTKSKPPLRFFKFGRAYEFRKRGRAFTRFLGKEGTGYTWRLVGFDGTKENPTKIDLTFPTLEAAVKKKWGNEFYESVPEERKEQLRDNRLLVTVDLEGGMVPEGYEPINEDIIEETADREMAEIFAHAAKGMVKKDLLERIAWIGCGVAIGFAIHIFFL